jgi:hypothetical protein
MLCIARRALHRVRDTAVGVRYPSTNRPEAIRGMPSTGQL